MATNWQGYFDGACFPCNPGGHACWGALMKRNGQVVWQDSGYIGSGREMSNNVAEYAGLIALLKWIAENVPATESVLIFGDSKLVIKQISGKWGAKSGLYFERYREANKLRLSLPQVRYRWIPRELNWEADLLSKSITV